MVSNRKVDLETALQRVTARLVRRFGERVDPTLVEATVRGCAAEFADATVLDFVPVLVERRSVERLNAAAAHGGCPTPGRPSGGGPGDRAA